MKGRLRSIGLWIASLVGIGALAGLSSSFFLQVLDRIGELFASHPWLALGLPLFGVLSAWLYQRTGGLSERGTNLLLEEIQSPSRPVPWQMAPLVLVGTFLTHLGGGSAGREGTAVQMAGSLSDTLGRFLRLPTTFRPTLLRAGASAGFAAVFGTPWAGCLFGMEVAVTGRIAWSALVPCLASGWIAHHIALLTGARHTLYTVLQWPSLTPSTLAYLLVAGLAFGLTARFYSTIVHLLTRHSKRFVPNPLARIAIGGSLVACVLLAVPTGLRYAGLGLPIMMDSFRQTLPPWDFAAKAVLTATTLGFGFKGGEVTPLFCVGASLGNALSAVLSLPMSFLAAMGFVAVFGACANVPLSASLMAFELFGPAALPWALFTCLVAFSVSGKTGIYTSQGRTFDKF
ncbi:MAG: hypothetical protein RL318_3073 [Fibrobacterota bacterium]|jgi:H+/Cl- antiporter ClcA